MLTYNHFTLAYLFFCVAGIWAITYWQLSDHLADKSAELRKKDQKVRKSLDKHKNIIAFDKARRDYWLSNLLGSCVLLALIAACLAWTHSAQTEYELSQPAGWLLPANDPSPQSNCSPNSDELALYMGTIASVSSTFPHTVITYGNQPKLIVDRNDKHQIAVTVDVRGQDNKIIATIDKNEFNLTQNALQTHKPRPDKSTLVVHDEYGNEVLSVRYLNPQAIRISGTLYYGGHRIDLPIRNVYHACMTHVSDSDIDIVGN